MRCLDLFVSAAVALGVVIASVTAPTSTDPDVLTVFVVDHETGQPVADADVVWGDQDPPEGSLQYHATVAYALFDTTRPANRTRTDASGRAQVRTSASLTIAAMRGEAFGSRHFTEAPHGEVRLAIVSGAVIQARVIDARGEPVPGVDVWFSLSARTEGRSSQTFFMSATRAPDGVAFGGHTMRLRGTLEGTVTVRATVIGTAARAESVAATVDEAARRPLTITVTRAARVTVHARDPEGAPITGDVRVWLGRERSPQESGLEAALVPSRAAMRDGVNGVAQFVTVEPDGGFSVAARCDAFEHVCHPASLTPAPGGGFDVDVRFARRKPILSGRIVGPDRAPLGRRQIHVDLVPTERASSRQPHLVVVTDGDGRFSIPVERYAFHGEGCALLVEAMQSPVLVACSDAMIVPPFGNIERRDLGDVELQVPTPLVSGKVVDEFGRPMADVTLDLEPRSMRGGQSSRDHDVVGGGDTAPHRHRVRTASDGGFTIAAAPSVDDVRITSFSLTAQAEGYVQVPSSPHLEAGTTDRTIVLHGAGTIEGSLVTDEAAPVARLVVAVERADSTSDQRPAVQTFGAAVDSNGMFTLVGILPGTVSVSIRRVGDLQPLATIDGVAVTRLGVTRDARLRALDVRPKRPR